MCKNYKHCSPYAVRTHIQILTHIEHIHMYVCIIDRYLLCIYIYMNIYLLVLF